MHLDLVPGFLGFAHLGRITYFGHMRRILAERPAEWKKMDLLQDVLPTRFRNLTDAQGGTITIDEYNVKVLEGRNLSRAARPTRGRRRPLAPPVRPCLHPAGYSNERGPQWPRSACLRHLQSARKYPVGSKEVPV